MLNGLQDQINKEVNISCTYSFTINIGCEAIGTRVNGIVLSKSLEFFNRTLNRSTCIRGFAICLVKKISSFVKVARFPRNGGIKTVA